MQNLLKRKLKWDGDTDENCLEPPGGAAGGAGGVDGGEATKSAPPRIRPEKGPLKRETTKLSARTRSEVPRRKLQSKKTQTRPQKKGRLRRPHQKRRPRQRRMPRQRSQLSSRRKG